MQKALSLKPEYYDARRNIAELFALTGEREKAQENMAWVLRRNPADVDLRLMMAELLMEKGNFREALDHFKFVFRLRPDCDRARSGINAAGKALQDMRGSRRGG